MNQIKEKYGAMPSSESQIPGGGANIMQEQANKMLGEMRSIASKKILGLGGKKR